MGLIFHSDSSPLYELFEHLTATINASHLKNGLNSEYQDNSNANISQQHTGIDRSPSKASDIAGGNS